MTSDFAIALSNCLEMEDLEMLRDNGAIAGIPGLVYYKETSELYTRFSHDIWTAVVDYSDANGFKVNDTVSNIITAECDSHEHFANNMVWFAAEYYVNAAIKLKRKSELYDYEPDDDDFSEEEDNIFRL